MRPTHRAPRHGRFPTTADMGIWARGSSPEELLEGLGLALYAAMTRRERVRALERRTVRARGDDAVALAVAFLGELVLLFQTEGFLARSLTVRLTGPGALEAELLGEPFEAERHIRGTEVKAVTLHRALFDPVEGRARIILDI